MRNEPIIVLTESDDGRMRVADNEPVDARDLVASGIGMTRLQDTPFAAARYTIHLGRSAP
jgi:hypothetical protein